MASALLALLLTASITHTETVQALSAFNGHVVACTGGGLELFTPEGQPTRVLRVEDQLPSHLCYALQPVGDHLFVATEEGVVALDTAWRVEPVLMVRWHALPAVAGRDAKAYREALEALAGQLPPGPAYTAFAPGYAGTADGRVLALQSQRTWAVPGPVALLEEAPHGTLRVGTREGAFILGPNGLEEVPTPPGPLAYAQGSEGPRVLGATGETRRWGDITATADTLPPSTTAALEVQGRLWAGTRGQGVFRREPQGWRRLTPTGQLCGNHVTALARHQGRLVVGTFDSGVCWQSPNGRWQSFRPPAIPSPHVLGLASDGRNLYVATTHGLGLYDGKTWTQLAYGGRNPVALGRLSLLAAIPHLSEGLALVDGRGLSLVRPQSQPLSLHRRLPLPEGWSSHASVADGAGRFLWVGSEDRGLLRWDGNTWQRFHDGKHLTDNWITALAADAQGRAVAGTCQDGFSYFDGHTWTRVRQGLPAPAVVSVALVPGGVLVGTLRGAVHYDAATGELRPLPPLADPRVYALLVEDGALIAGTEAGLSFSVPGQQRLAAAGP